MSPSRVADAPFTGKPGSAVLRLGGTPPSDLALPAIYRSARGPIELVTVCAAAQATQGEANPRFTAGSCKSSVRFTD
jgi:hypothetical protein